MRLANHAVEMMLEEERLIEKGEHLKFAFMQTH